MECFSYKYSDFDIKNKILLLKEKIENHYKIQLNFYDNFLDFPQFTDSGSYGQLIINKDINNKPPKKINRRDIVLKDEIQALNKSQSK